ncbi:bifunctional 3-(3-hydroxy-phenyl)propionate/3-hydroxycinnamic acid hydroxylase MhpA [Thermaurantiacus sp.]
MKPVETDVVIIGLGPVGAVMALLLADEGLRVTVIERERHLYPHPRAAHFDHEIMRLFQSLGLADAALACSRVASAYEFRGADGAPLFRFELPREGTPSGWAASYMFNQPDLEAAIRGRLHANPFVSLCLGARYVGHVQSSEHVVVQVSDDPGDREIVASWLIGADGASSAVRATSAISLDDLGFDEPWLVVDVAPEQDAPLSEINLQICDPARPTTCVPLGPGRHRFEFMVLAGDDPSRIGSPEFVQSLLEPWGCAGRVRILRTAVYRFHALIARQWRQGRVFLIGDAAHQMPPFAGQGMCSGLRDAANLAWKLAMVHRGQAGDRLLDSYQSEREPHVRALVHLAIEMGKVVCTLDPENARRRDEALRARVARGEPALPAASPPALGPGCHLGTPAATHAGPVEAGHPFPQLIAQESGKVYRLDDYLDKGPVLISRSCESRSSIIVGLEYTYVSEAPPLQTLLDNLFRQNHFDAILLRPDRIVFGMGSVEQLRTEWKKSLM